MSEIIYNKELKPFTRLILFVLVDFHQKNIHPSLRKIGEMLNVSHQGVLNGLEELKEYGYIEIEKIGRKNFYKINKIS